MRNLKKTLCLVLALVFVLGLCTVATGAAFDDAAEIQYEDAITVLSGLGIVQGDDNDFDGKMEFRPLDGVTRAQAAKMITYMMLGADNAEKLISKQVFDDVAANNWAAKYVYFCYNKGIINGYGDGNFGPADPVTGTQLAKMLLCAAGYGCMGEYTGEGWDVNVFVDAVSEGIFEDANTADFSVAATREEAALYVFNALTELGQVKYDVDQNKYIGYKAPFGSDVWDLADTTEETGNFIVEANQATGADYTVINGVNFAIETGLELIGHDVDVYYKADQKKDAEGNKYYEAYLVEDTSSVVTVGMSTIGEIGKALGFPTTDFADVTCYTNYVETSDVFSVGAYASFGKADVGTANADYGYFYLSMSGNLVLNEEGELISYLATAYTVDQVTSVEDGVINLKNGGEFVAAAEAEDTDEVYVYAYEGIAKKDLVTLQPVGEVFYIYPTSVATSAIFEINNYFFAGSYYFNYFGFSPATAPDVAVENEDLPASVALGDTVDFYLDYYGSYFALDVVAHGASKGNVLLVATYTEEVTSYGVPVEYNYAQCIDAEGNEVIYLIESADASKALGVYSLYTTTSTEYHATGDTVAKFEDIAADEDYSDNYTFKGYGDDNKLPGTNKYFADDVTIIYFDGEKADLEVEVAAAFNEGAADVYCYIDSSETVPVIWVKGTAPADVADSYMYVSNYDSVTSAWNMSDAKVSVVGNDYYYFTTFVDGALNYGTTVKTVNNAPLSFGLIPVGFYTYSVDENGLYALKSVDAAKTATVSITKENIYKGKLSIAGMFDDVDISGLKVVDLYHGVNAKGYAQNISTIDGILDLLADDLTVEISFVTVHSNEYDADIPTGALYVSYYG